MQSFDRAVSCYMARVEPISDGLHHEHKTSDDHC